jgi:phosphopantetheinyl transferase (holo-ACP synthase)
MTNGTWGMTLAVAARVAALVESRDPSLMVRLYQDHERNLISVKARQYRGSPEYAHRYAALVAETRAIAMREGTITWAEYNVRLDSLTEQQELLACATGATLVGAEYDVEPVRVLDSTDHEALARYGASALAYNFRR